ncbi:16921_t:CDS:2, partial [Dentiscutata erythropus]
EISELLNKQITSLHNRLNDEGIINKITELRIWQGHQIAGLTESFDGREEYIALEKLWKYNQAMLTLVKEAKKQLVTKPTQGSWGTRDIALGYAGEADDYSIENQMITNFDTREIKQDLQTSSTNKLAVIPPKINNKENKPDIRRVISKSKERFHTEKWLISKEEKGFRKQNNSWVLDMTQSSLEGIRKNNIDLERTSRRETDKGSYSLEHASLADIVYIDRLERDYIKKQEFSEYCDGLLLNQLDRNIETDQKALTFYTDSSLSKEMSNGRALSPNLRIQEVVASSRLRYSIYWQNSLIEIPTRNFIKELEDTRSAAEWRMLSTQTHWHKIEQAAIEIVQALISEPERRGKLQTSELQKYLFGETYKEQKERREGYTRGLFKNTVIEELIDQGLTKREADLALDAAIHKNSYQKSRKPPNSKEATLQKVKDRKKLQIEG